MGAAVGGVGDVASAWLVGEVPSSAVAELFATLDAQERRRVTRFSTPEARGRFVIAHGATRQIVGECLGAPPGELQWEVGAQGKPELVGPWTGVHANLSHSGGRCLIAVSRVRAVGADIQRLVPGLDVLGMARRYFPASEARDVADAADPADAFARLWARKEAVTKAAGGRLTQVLPLLTPPGGIVEFVAGVYRVVDVEVPAGFRAAVALAGADEFRVEVSEWVP
ncbi:4'-phosphopantetheinyl transferase family protein [Catenulispora rubra]|uniref:4'-phosphopantetheinyl transferase family protein n=1 Tax=Catenulispora rubra TaxID=280293 RepID=UPI0018926322|nr:4'-phosphopantetheinyl transferase superfamily protein [Catenulispora rubra]